MRAKLLSYDLLERTLGARDAQDTENRTNRRGLKAAEALLKEAIRTELTEKQRACVELYYFQQLNQPQIAKALGVDRSTVCRHLKKARERLGRALRYAGEGMRGLRED